VSESDTGSRNEELGAEHRRVLGQLARVDDAIARLEAVGARRPADAALLAKYRQNHERLDFERQVLASEIQEQNRHSHSDGLVAALSDEMLDRVRDGRVSKERA